MKYNILAAVLALLGTGFIAKGITGGAPKIAQFEAPKTITAKVFEVSGSGMQAKSAIIRTAVEPEVIVLNKENTLSFSDTFTAMTVAQFQKDLQEMSNRLPKDSEIIVVMYTPGGDIRAGSAMIDSVRAVPQKVKTLNLFSASMGFHFAQGAGERMVTPSGVLMQHRAHGGVEGDFDGNLESRYKMSMAAINRLKGMSAARMNKSMKEYEDLVREEYWTSGQDAVDEGAADRVVYARCDSSLDGEHVKDYETIFGPIPVRVASCPLMTFPLGIAGDARGQALINLMYNDTPTFVKDYILTGKYNEVLK